MTMAALCGMALTGTVQAAGLAYEELCPLPNFYIKGLVQGTDSNLYGVSWTGGSADYGYVFRATLGGQFTVLTNFTQSNGAYPMENLVAGTNGVIYGLTSYGGTSDYGTLFRITTNGAMTTMLNFGSSSVYSPHSLLWGRDGNVYGAHDGGLFRMTPGGSFTNLGNNYSSPDNPVRNFQSVVQDTNSAFYLSGTHGGSNETGGIVRYDAPGQWSLLHAYTDSDADSIRLAGVLKGYVYGYSTQGGADGYGYFFKVPTNGGKMTVVSSFTYDKGNSVTELSLGQDGSFYGTDQGGGALLAGSVFKMSSGGAMTPVITFGYQMGYPMMAFRSASGVYYGVAYGYGINASLFRTTGISYGSFNALFPSASGGPNDGYLTVKISGDLKYSGKITLDGQTYAFSGTQSPFVNDGYCRVIISRPGKPVLRLDLSLRYLSAGQLKLQASVYENGGWIGDVYGDAPYFSATRPAAKAGTYTMTLLPDGDGSTAPGYGTTATITVAPEGTIKASGKLSDTTSFSATGYLSQDNQWALYAPLYKGTGYLSGVLTLTNLPNSRLNGNVKWMKTGASGKHYPAGFNSDTIAVGSLLP